MRYLGYLYAIQTLLLDIKFNNYSQIFLQPSAEFWHINLGAYAILYFM